MSFRKNILNPGFIIYYIFLLFGGILLFLYPKGDILLWINRHHNGFMDQFFKYWTHLGDGLVFALLIVVFLMFSYYRTIILIMAGICQTLLIQGLKRFVFSDVVRPKMFFDNFGDLYQVAGVDIHSFNSFPSGHTATAFTVAVLLVLFFRNRYLNGLFMIMAILVGISRVYLLQHFFIDIYFGSIVGFLNSVLVYSWMEKTSFNKNPALKRGLIKK